MALPGLKLLVPSSVTNSGGTASVSATGKITFSGCTSVSVNGVFSSSYNNYLLIMYSTGGGAADNQNIRWRVAGSDSNTNYYDQRYRFVGTSEDSGRFSGQADNQVSQKDNSAYIGDVIWIYAPALATETGFRSFASFAGDIRFEHWAGMRDASTVYDGFTLSSGNGETGMMCVYGLNQ